MERVRHAITPKATALWRACALFALGSVFASAHAQPRVNGGRSVEEKVFTAALVDRKPATQDEAKAFNMLFTSRDIAMCFFDELTRVTILWQPRSSPKPVCMKDAIVRVETLDGRRQVVGTAYCRVETPYLDGKGMILPFDNLADKGKSIRMTILPADTKTIVTISLAIARH